MNVWDWWIIALFLTITSISTGYASKTGASSLFDRDVSEDSYSSSDSEDSDSNSDDLSELDDIFNIDNNVDGFGVDDLVANKRGTGAFDREFEWNADAKDGDFHLDLTSSSDRGEEVRIFSGKSKVKKSKKARKSRVESDFEGEKNRKHKKNKKKNKKLKDKSQHLDKKHYIKPIFTHNHSGTSCGESRASDNIKKKQFNNNELENNIYKKIATELNKDSSFDISSISESIRYLGSGYDIIFGNPIGDPLMMVDPGYRNPVIQLQWDSNASFGHHNSLPQPFGGWVRPEISCKQAEKVDHVDSIEDYKKELSVDAMASSDLLSFFAFSASGGYKNFAKSMTKEKMRSFILKTYCLRYIAGLDVSGDLTLTKGFKQSVANLPLIFDGFDENTLCPVEKYRANENDPDCKTNIDPWMNFFREFGTHFTSVVHLGGKMTYQMQMKQSDVNKLQERGVNVDASIKATCGFGMPSVSGKLNVEDQVSEISNLNEYKVDKMVLVIGGEPPKDLVDSNNLNNWAKSVAKSPMPIKSELIPLRELFESKKLKESYNQAIKYYAEVYGISQDEMYEIKGKIKGIPQLIRESQQVTYAGPAPGRVICPIGTTILFGFSMTITKKKKSLKIFEDHIYDVNITPCTVGNEMCSGANHNGSSARIWAMCSPNPAPLLVQVTSHKTNGPATAECPKGFNLGLGFGITLPKGLQVLPHDIYSCRNGQNSCTKIPDSEGSTAVWAVCFETGAMEINNLVNKTVAGSSPKCEGKESVRGPLTNTCPDGFEVLAGWSMALMSKNSHTDNHFKTCRGMANCPIAKHKNHENECVAYSGWNICGFVDPERKTTMKEAHLSSPAINSNRVIKQYERL